MFPGWDTNSSEVFPGLGMFPLRDIKYSDFFCPMPPHVLADFVVLSPGHDRSVTDFWGWDAHEAQLRCPDDVSGDIEGRSARRALKPKFYQPTQTMFTARILPSRENSQGRGGNRTRDLIISRQRLWPLDHGAGHILKCSLLEIEIILRFSLIRDRISWEVPWLGHTLSSDVLWLDNRIFRDVSCSGHRIS